LVLLILFLCREFFSARQFHEGVTIWQLLQPSLVKGLLNPFAYYLVLFAAYDRLPAQVVQPINYSWIIVLTLMSMVFLKQKMAPSDLAAGFICYLGVGIIASRGDFQIVTALTDTGLLLAVLSTLIWATYWILNIRDERDPLTAMLFNFLVALPFVMLACYWASDFNIKAESGTFFAIYIGIFEMSVAFLCWSLALKKAENSSRVGNLIFITPFLSLLLIHHILGEQIYASTWMGLLLIISGLMVQKFGKRVE